MINETIKNKYIVCKSPEHGKKIIEFFVANGAVNENNFKGVGDSYFVSQENGIILHEDYPDHYTEMELPEEFTPKRVDMVEVSYDGVYWQTMIFLTEIKGAVNPFICVCYGNEEDYLNGDQFSIMQWRFCRPPQTITKAEAEKLLGKKIEG